MPTPPGTSTILKSPKYGSRGHGCSLHLQNRDKEQKFGSWVYKISVTICKSRLGCQYPVGSLWHPSNSENKDLKDMMLFAPSKS